MNTTLSTQDIAYIVIDPLVSYLALGFVLIAIATIVTLGSVIGTKSKNSDLILFKDASKNYLELFNIKQMTNKAAMNNVHGAIAANLMVPPPNYVEPSKHNGSAIHNGNL